MGKRNDYRTVQIVVRATDYDRVKVVKISNVCPICKHQRGHIYKSFSYIGTKRVDVDRWINECGHIDFYGLVYEEACNNGMNPNLEKDIPLVYFK